MKRANKLFVQMLFSVMLLFVVIALPVVQKTSNADTSPLSGLPVGTKIMFGGQLFSVVNPANGLVVSRKITHKMVFDGSSTQAFNPDDTNNIGYYLNNESTLTTSYYNTFTPAQKALIKTATWYTGDSGNGTNFPNETTSSVMAKIGLLRESEYVNLARGTTDNSPAEAGKIFPKNGEDVDWFLITPSISDLVTVRYIRYNGTVSNCAANYAIGVRPAFQIEESTIFTYDHFSGIYYQGSSTVSAGTVSGLTTGSSIMFGNTAYRVVNPSEGLMVMDYSINMEVFDIDKTQAFNPDDSNNIGYYLNNEPTLTSSYYNTFTPAQKTLIKTATWYTGHSGNGANFANETTSSVMAKIGLLRESEYVNLARGTTDNSRANVGKIFPKDGEFGYFWLITPRLGFSTDVRIVSNDGVVSDYKAHLRVGLRPALQIKENTNVSSVNGQAGVYIINSAPTDIALSSNSIAENLASGTNVGTLSRTDPDAGDTEAYTLVAGAGDTDNASFSITGTDLNTAAIFNFDVKNSYSIRVRVTDGGGLWYEKVFTITVIDLLLSEAINIIITPIGGNVIANTLNTTNLNLIATAKIVAGQATGGHAELLIDGVVKLTDNTITAIDTTVDFDTSDGSPSNNELQTAIAAGGVVSVKLYDALSNSNISSVGNPTLVVDYIKPWANDITININEDSTTGWFNLDCGDVGGESLVMAFGGNNLPGTFGTNGTTSVWFNPDSNWNGLAWFFFKINGSNGNTSEWKSVYITVNPINDAPWANNKTETEITQTDEDLNTGWIDINCGDIDGDTLTIELAASNNIPGVFDTNNSTYRYYPEPNWFGEAWFDFRVKDSSGLVSDWKHEIIYVSEVNDAPTVSDKVLDMMQDAVFTFDSTVFSNYNDINGDLLSNINIRSLPTNGVLKFNGNPINDCGEWGLAYTIDEIPLIQFYPNINWSGVTSFKWEAVTGVGKSSLVSLDTANITINVNSTANTPPAIAEQIKKVFSYTGSTKFKLEQFTQKFVDNDGNTLKKVQITSLPSVEGQPRGTLKVGDRIININDEINFAELNELTFINGEFSSDRYTQQSYTVVFKWKGFDGVAYSNEATFKLEIEKLTLDIG